MGDSIGARIGRKSLFLTSVGRNALVVIATGIIAYAVGEGIFTLTGKFQKFYFTVFLIQPDQVRVLFLRYVL